MNSIIKLTGRKEESILIGVNQIIEVTEIIFTETNGTKYPCTRIRSVGAMVTTNYVKESVDEIYEKINCVKNL
jgi:hypothetical protein